MKIGFYFECSKRSGGAYQYALNILDAFKENGEYSYIIFNISTDFPFEDYKLPNWRVINLIPEAEARGPQMTTPHRPTLRRSFNLFIRGLIRRLHLHQLEIFLERLKARERAQKFLGYDIDLMFFHGPSDMSFLTDIPAVLPIHDLNHRFHTEFPELVELGQYEKREYANRNIIKNAFRVLVDSDVGKEDIVNTYGCQSDRIEVFPPTPPTYLDKDISDEEATMLLEEFNLPDRFIFYPAQLWPHKNHMHLIRAIKLLKDRGLSVPLVLVGTKQDIWGEYNKIIKQIEEYGLKDLIHFPGYADNRQMGALFKRADFLAMPTRVGWTHIPVVEAWHMGCPVLYSDVRGCREQGGDAALICNPSNPEDIAEKIAMLWTDNLLRQELVKKGYSRLGLWTKKDLNNKVKQIINDFKKETNR